MTALHARLERAVLVLPACEREVHLNALAGLLHLLEHCGEGREPVGFVAGWRAYQHPALRWAAAMLGHEWRVCVADCDEPDHVSLVDAPVAVPTGRAE